MIASQPLARTRPLGARVRVLFDSPAAWPVLSRQPEGEIGGAEVRAVTFARALAERPGFDVQVLVQADRAAPSPTVGRLTVHFESRAHKTADHTAPWERLRRWSDRLAGSLVKHLTGIPERRRRVEQLDYDVLCCFGVTNRTASLVRSARRTGRRAMVFLTSDRTLADLQLRNGRQRGLYGERGYLCRYGLESADAVIVQTRWQQSELQRLLGIAARLIRNPIDLQSPGRTPRPKHLPAERYALWVGRADTFSKRADLCWRLARACPDVSIVAIMNARDPIAFEQFRATQPANVRLIRYVPVDRIDAYFQHAVLLINTSDTEGFPNSFLQAGKYGVPIVSLNADPDGMLSTEGCGICCRASMAVMQRQVGRLIRQGSHLEPMAERIRQYTHRFHQLHGRVDELEAAIGELTQRRMAA